MKILAIDHTRAHPSQWVLRLDDGTACVLDEATIVAEQLAVGDELSQADLDRIRSASAERGLLDAAMRFLGTRPRSRAEVRRRLQRPRQGKPAPDPEAVERVLDRLATLGLLSDRGFAEFWVENRDQFSPRSARAMRQELALRGVDRETLDATVDSGLDEERALTAARQRLRSLTGLDYPAFASRLNGFLLRRGFGYGVTRDTVRALWQEAHGDLPEDANEEPEVGDQ